MRNRCVERECRREDAQVGCGCGTEKRKDGLRNSCQDKAEFQYLWRALSPRRTHTRILQVSFIFSFAIASLLLLLVEATAGQQGLYSLRDPSQIVQRESRPFVLCPVQSPRLTAVIVYSGSSQISPVFPSKGATFCSMHDTSTL